MILLLEYYNIGDLIDINGTLGYVQEFNLLVTSLRDSNGVLINIPNNTIVTGVLTNYNKNKNLSAHFFINVSNYDQATDIKELCEKNQTVIEGKSTYATNKDEIKVVVNDMSKEGTLLKVKIPIESKNFIAAKEEARS
uniref:Mechanosensitive ion channel MscS domain-containing protein n=1 Tax=viral metagenome TaxID=1070528 RepID=A0A6C0I319_9ZZZZ